MPNYCVVFGCMNTPSNIVSLHQIPIGINIFFKLWKGFVSINKSKVVTHFYINHLQCRKDSFENAMMVDVRLSEKYKLKSNVKGEG